MIIRHFDPKYGDCFYHTDSVSVFRCSVKDSYKKNLDEATTGKPEIGRFDKVDAFNKTLTEAIPVPTGLPLETIVNYDYEDLDKVVVVIGKRDDRSPEFVLVFNEYTFLMTDTGKTVEKLI